MSFIFSARPGQAILSPIDWIETILKFRAIRDHLTSFLAFFKKIGNIIFTTQKVSSQSPKFGKKKCFSGLFLVIKFPFFCQFGGSSTRRRIKLKEMMDKDHGKKYLNGDWTTTKCNQCEYTSSWASNLRAHLKTHSGERSNKCNQCNYASSEAGDLRKQLNVHS